MVDQSVDISVDATMSRLLAWVSQYSSAIVAYSGGVDSAVIMAAAHQQLGNRALACIGVSPSYPKRELEAAVALAQKLNARCQTVATEEHLDARYAANPANRCYFCKSVLYRRLKAICDKESAEVILDGTNATDLSASRPGYLAAKELGVRSPLAELGITKSEVRELAKRLNLPVWNKPASPCLASRVPTGVGVDPRLLHQIELAEDVLVRLGFTEFRVRHHGDVARVELALDEIAAAVERRVDIVQGIRAAGYRFVALDLGGLRSGSLNVLS